MVHSIRFKVTAITIAEIIAAILCVFLISYSMTSSENEQRSVETLDLVAQDTRMTLENQTEDMEQSVEAIANLASDTLDGVELVQGGIAGNTAQSERTEEQVEQLDAYLSEYLKRLQADFATVSNHTRGVITYYYCISPDVSTTEHGFFYSRVGKTGFTEREPLDARELDPDDIEHTTWYYTPIQRGRPSWVGPYTAHFLNEMWICSYVVPIYKSGAFIGVLGMDISLDALISQVSSIRVYDTGFACLLDAEGHVLYHPELDFGTMIDVPISQELLSHEDNGNALIRYDAHGEERQVSFTTLANGMKLAIVAPTSEINASATRLSRAIAPAAVVLVLAIATLTLLLMGYITRPLQRLTAASSHLADADYDVELDYQGKDEVGALTVAFQRMRDRMQTYIADLNRKVLIDDLTGLPNQRYFFELATPARDCLLDDGKSPVMLYFNLMGMKHFNRQYGFTEGDKLICEVARILSDHFGEDRTSRFGQDHFAAVSDEDGLEEELKKVFADVRAANGGNTLPISVGIYQNSLEIVDASVACDRAKYASDMRRGSYYSGFKYFDIGMLQQADMFRYVVNHLDQAIEEQWIQVYYQPIVRSVNGRVCDEEALSRWIDPVRGRLSPAEFIPALEDSGLIYKLDLYVLDQVLDKINQQRAIGLTIVPHSINLSRSDFESRDMVEEIRQRVDASGVPHDKITIEITESIIGSSFDFMKKQVERFQALGFPVWMDDFGSGYSSLDFLQRIRFDLLKFDMSFLRMVDKNESSKIILTELMQMATALGVDTLCEGVETEYQQRFLREIGCSKLQGYYYSKPNSLEELFKRYATGTQIGYENPQESAYYEAIGKVNLHDLTAVASEGEDALQNIFNTLPMSVIEITGEHIELVRSNESYRDFMEHYLVKGAVTIPFDEQSATGGEAIFMQHARECQETDARSIFDVALVDGNIAHFMMRRVGKNPVTGTTAIAIAVLSISEAR